MALSITRAASGVAPLGVLPVLVFKKSTPASSPSWQACWISAGVFNSPDSMISLRVLPAQAWRTAASSAVMARRSAASPPCKARQGSTRSISSPPAWMMALASASATAAKSSPPLGKLATAAMRMWAGSSARACATNRGQTHSAAGGPARPTARWARAAVAAASSASFRLVRSRQANARRAVWVLSTKVSARRSVGMEGMAGISSAAISGGPPQCRARSRQCGSGCVPPDRPAAHPRR